MFFIALCGRALIIDFYSLNLCFSRFFKPQTTNHKPQTTNHKLIHFLSFFKPFTPAFTKSMDFLSVVS